MQGNHRALPLGPVPPPCPWLHNVGGCTPRLIRFRECSVIPSGSAVADFPKHHGDTSSTCGTMERFFVSHRPGDVLKPFLLILLKWTDVAEKPRGRMRAYLCKPGGQGGILSHHSRPLRPKRGRLGAGQARCRQFAGCAPAAHPRQRPRACCQIASGRAGSTPPMISRGGKR